MRRHYVAITIDHEVWDPNEIPEDKKDEFPIDFQKDVVDGMAALLQIANQTGAKLTIMAEMGEYLWLKQHQPEMAEKIAAQWRKAVCGGHDVQLHLHPNWLPEMGVSFSPYYADPAFSNLCQYPFDITRMMERCVSELEKAIRPAAPDYRVTCYRAGGYRVQPFDRTFDALQKCGICADSSVYRGGKNKFRNYDFGKCKKASQPYMASRKDPAREDADSGFLELPIHTYKKGKCWSLDYSGSQNLYTHFLHGCKKEHEKIDNCFVMIGHSKTPHDLPALERQLKLLAGYPGLTFITLSEIAKKAQSCGCHFDRMQHSLEEIQKIAEAISSPEITDPNNALPAEKTAMEKTRSALGLFRQWGYRCYGAQLTRIRSHPDGTEDKTHRFLIEVFFKKKICTVDPLTGLVAPYAVRKLICEPASKKNDQDAAGMGKDVVFFQKDPEVEFYLRRFWTLWEEKQNMGRRYEIGRRVRNACLFSLPYSFSQKIR